MPTSKSHRHSARRIILIGIVCVVVIALGIGAFALGAFDRFFAPDEPYRDPLLDTFEQRIVPGSETDGESSFSVGEPGTVPPRVVATSSATTTEDTTETNESDSETITPGEGDEDTSAESNEVSVE